MIENRTLKIPTITVVVPSLNQGDTIEQTLKSILEFNSPEGLETIVVDGISSDATSSVLKQWKSRIIIIREKDRGQADAINKGFKRAEGEILCWLNTDDLYFPGALDRVRRLFAQNPEVEVISGLGVHLNKDGSFLNLHPDGPDFSNDFSVRHRIFTVLQPSVFFRRSLLERVGGINPEIPYVMDWDLWCRFYSAKASWLKVSDYFSAARIYSGTKTSRGGINRIFTHWRVARKHTGDMLPISTLQLFLFWALYDRKGVLRWIFHQLRKLKYFRLSKEIKPAMFYSTTCFPEYFGEAEITFPWYQGKVSSLKCVIELEPPPAHTGPVNVIIIFNGLKKDFHVTSKRHTFEINSVNNNALIDVSISTSPKTDFQVIELTPKTLQAWNQADNNRDKENTTTL